MALSPAAGCLSRPKEDLRDRLSQCYYLQRWDGNTWTAEELKERIFLDGIPRRDPFNTGGEYATPREMYEAMRPFIVIWHEQVQFTQNAAPGSYDHAGLLRAEFQQNIPSDQANNPEEIEREFDNLLGLTLQSGDMAQPGLAELAEQSGAIHHAMGSEFPTGRTPEDELNALGDAFYHVLTFQWGIPQ